MITTLFGIILQAVSQHNKINGLYFRKKYLGNLDNIQYPNATIFLPNISTQITDNGQRATFNFELSVYDKFFTDENGNVKMITEDLVENTHNQINGLINPYYQLFDNTLAYAQHIVSFIIENADASGGLFYVNESEIRYQPSMENYIDNVVGHTVRLQITLSNTTYCDSQNFKKQL